MSDNVGLSEPEAFLINKCSVTRFDKGLEVGEANGCFVGDILAGM